MAINNRLFSMFKTGKRIMQRLMTVCLLNIHVCHQITIGQLFLTIKKLVLYWVDFLSFFPFFSIRSFFHETFKFLLSMSRYEEDIIHILYQSNYYNDYIFRKSVANSSIKIYAWGVENFELKAIPEFFWIL